MFKIHRHENTAVADSMGHAMMTGREWAHAMHMMGEMSPCDPIADIPNMTPVSAYRDAAGNIVGHLAVIAAD